MVKYWVSASKLVVYYIFLSAGNLWSYHHWMLVSKTKTKENTACWFLSIFVSLDGLYRLQQQSRVLQSCFPRNQIGFLGRYFIYIYFYEWCCPQTQEITHRDSSVYIMLNYYFLDFLIFYLTIEVIGEAWNQCVYWQVPRRLRKHFKSFKTRDEICGGSGISKANLQHHKNSRYNGNLLGVCNRALLTTWRSGKGQEVGGWFSREGTYVYLWLIHVDVWQKPKQYCKAIILQLKINVKKKTHQGKRHFYPK